MPWLARLALIAGSRLAAGCREAPKNTQTAAPIATATSNPRPPSTTRLGIARSRLGEELGCTILPSTVRAPDDGVKGLPSLVSVAGDLWAAFSSFDVTPR
jgi:hypothetical protein